MDILREKAQLEAQKLVTPTLDSDTERRLEELKATDPDKWYQERKRLDNEHQQAIQSKTEELYKQYKLQEQLSKANLSEDELKAKLTAKEYEEFKRGELELDKVINKEDNPAKEGDTPKKEDNPKQPNSNTPPIDITRQKNTSNNKDDKSLEELYVNGVF